MRLLLDTHAFLWQLSGDPQLSSTARAAIESPANVINLSVASVWEMAIKAGIRKLRLPPELLALAETGFRDAEFQLLGLQARHAVRVADLPMHHRDPFDRLLAAQCLIEGLSIVSIDPSFEAYGVARVW